MSDNVGRYGNLLDISSAMQTQGGILKFLGLLTAVGGSVGGYFTVGLFGLAIAIPAGITFYVFGTFTAAAGEAMMALADIATNTERRS